MAFLTGIILLLVFFGVVVAIVIKSRKELKEMNSRKHKKINPLLEQAGIK